ncbi:MAG: cadherin-like domain-containing protein, partial [Acidobacteria bacterium]|nr:cadherin-like domain-containing protein [Acidobacteriota bacterium]
MDLFHPLLAVRCPPACLAARFAARASALPAARCRPGRAATPPEPPPSRPPADNFPPVATNDDTTTVSDPSALTTAEDTALDIATSELLSNDSDVDADTLSITAVSAGTAGTPALSADGTTITFTPATNFNGDATFTYTASDSSLTDTGTV